MTCEPSPSAPVSRASNSGSPSSSRSSPSSSSSGTLTVGESSNPATLGSLSERTSSSQLSLFGQPGSGTPASDIAKNSRPGSRASRGQRQGSARAPTTTAGSGPSSPCGFAWYDPATSSWRTSQGSLLEGLDTFSGTWPRCGLMRRGECSPASPWAPAIAGSASSSWPTATSSDHQGLYQGDSRESRLREAVHSWPTPAGGGEHWPTPCACDEKGGSVFQDGNSRPLRDEAQKWSTPLANDRQARNSQDDGEQLGRQAMHWATPAAADHNGTPGGNQGRSLRSDISSWATPQAHDSQGGGSMQERDLAREATTWSTPLASNGPKGATSNHAGLCRDAESWPTPKACVDKMGRPRPSLDTLARSGRLDPPPTGQPSTSDSGRRLNPLFVEWLMGAPIGWSDPSAEPALRRWATACQHLLGPLLGAFCPAGWGCRA